jgi:hypothetical protein
LGRAQPPSLPGRPMSNANLPPSPPLSHADRVPPTSTGSGPVPAAEPPPQLCHTSRRRSPRQPPHLIVGPGQEPPPILCHCDGPKGHWSLVITMVAPCKFFFAPSSRHSAATSCPPLDYRLPPPITGFGWSTAAPPVIVEHNRATVFPLRRSMPHPPLPPPQ